VSVTKPLTPAPKPAAREVEFTEPPLQAPPRVHTEAAIVELRARPAPVWRRLVAGIVDTGILAGTVLAFLAVASVVTRIKAPNPHLSGVDAVLARLQSWQPLLVPAAGLAAVLAVAYATVFGVLGRTPGRRLAGLRLVDGDGLSPAPVRAAARALLALASFGLFLGGFWWALFDRRGQTFHDKLTRTFVVRPVRG
jgi:uncharacterized RDD family membrane protein YckC